MRVAKRYIASVVAASMLMMLPPVAVRSAEPAEPVVAPTLSPTPIIPIFTPRTSPSVHALGTTNNLLDPKGRPAWPCMSLGIYKITGYVRTEFSPWTHDGTSIYTDEKIVAASWNIPTDTLLRVEGLDYTYRVADRGHLSARHIDVAVWTRAEAFELTSEREVCVVEWGGK